MNVRTVTSTSLDNKAHKQWANKDNVSMKPGRDTKYNKWNKMISKKQIVMPRQKYTPISNFAWFGASTWITDVQISQHFIVIELRAELKYF